MTITIKPIEKDGIEKYGVFVDGSLFKTVYDRDSAVKIKAKIQETFKAVYDR